MRRLRRGLGAASTRYVVLAVLGTLGLCGSAYAMLSTGGPGMATPSFTAGPPRLTLRTSASFRFVSRGQAPSHNGHHDRVVLQCSFAYALFSACTSPVGFSRLGEGWHTFRVRAMDARTGELSGLATRRWLIDRHRPSVSLAFPANGGSYVRGSWNVGCAQGAGLCGHARARSGVRSVAVSIRQGAAGMWWGGHSFNRTREVFLAASGTTSWHYALAVPAAGGYTVHVRATNRLGRATTGSTFGQALSSGLSRDAAATFTIAAPTTVPGTPPPAPLITAHPADPSSSTSAAFSFTDQQAAVQFECALDGGSRRGCSSPISYGPLAAGTHHFEVVAVDGAGNTSGVASYDWTISQRPGVPFTITGGAPSLLYPGTAAQPISVTLHNPGNAPITVTSVTARLGSTGLPAGCDAAWFEIGQSTVSDTTPVKVPASGSVTLPAQGASAPTLQMIDSHSNQDACQKAQLAITYTGSAHS